MEKAKFQLRKAYDLSEKDPDIRARINEVMKNIPLLRSNLTRS